VLTVLAEIICAQALRRAKRVRNSIFKMQSAFGTISIGIASGNQVAALPVIGVTD